MQDKLSPDLPDRCHAFRPRDVCVDPAKVEFDYSGLLAETLEMYDRDVAAGVGYSGDEDALFDTIRAALSALDGGKS